MKVPPKTRTIGEATAAKLEVQTHRRALYERLAAGQVGIGQVLEAASHLRDESNKHRRNGVVLRLTPKEKALESSRAKFVLGAYLTGVRGCALQQAGTPKAGSQRVALAMLRAAGNHQANPYAGSCTPTQIRRIVWLCKLEPFEVPDGWPFSSPHVEDIEWKAGAWPQFDQKDIRWLSNRTLAEAYDRERKRSRRSGLSPSP